MKRDELKKMTKRQLNLVLERAASKMTRDDLEDFIVRGFDSPDDDTSERDAHRLYVERTRPAAVLGKLGGAKKTEKKAAACRNNGKLGGRPRKVVKK